MGSGLNLARSLGVELLKRVLPEIGCRRIINTEMCPRRRCVAFTGILSVPAWFDTRRIWYNPARKITRSALVRHYFFTFSGKCFPFVLASHSFRADLPRTSGLACMYLSCARDLKGFAGNCPPLTGLAAAGSGPKPISWFLPVSLDFTVSCSLV